MNSTRFAPEFRRRVAALFDQQLWCLGRDIARSEGNILLDLGMCRFRPPDPTRKSTLYTVAIEPAGSIFLWGFGAMYAEPAIGGVFVRRYGFAPRLCARESAVGIFTPEQLGPLTNPVSARDHQRLRTLLSRLVGWFARYEHWIAENFGTVYREHCLASRGKPNVVSARDMAKDWERVAKKSRRFRVSNGVSAGAWKPLLRRLRDNTQALRTANPRHSSWGKS